MLISGLGFTTTESKEVLKKVHEKLSTFCSSYGLIYTDNTNIRGLDLFQENPYLLQSGKNVLYMQ